MNQLWKQFIASIFVIVSNRFWNRRARQERITQGRHLFHGLAQLLADGCVHGQIGRHGPLVAAILRREPLDPLLCKRLAARSHSIGHRVGLPVLHSLEETRPRNAGQHCITKHRVVQLFAVLII